MAGMFSIRYRNDGLFAKDAGWYVHMLDDYDSAIHILIYDHPNVLSRFETKEDAREYLRENVTEYWNMEYDDLLKEQESRQLRLKNVISGFKLMSHIYN